MGFIMADFFSKTHLVTPCAIKANAFFWAIFWAIFWRFFSKTHLVTP
jgi:hypothetical protein